mmetsp:Transcript_120311/g.300118  ORF Transcript_120311/g.300118 Transcript_120311/m.300118 type:complete len:277 (+) Transcript_120311:1254-2084(+)
MLNQLHSAKSSTTEQPEHHQVPASNPPEGPAVPVWAVGTRALQELLKRSDRHRNEVPVQDEDSHFYCRRCDRCTAAFGRDELALAKSGQRVLGVPGLLSPCPHFGRVLAIPADADLAITQNVHANALVVLLVNRLAPLEGAFHERSGHCLPLLLQKRSQQGNLAQDLDVLFQLLRSLLPDEDRLEVSAVDDPDLGIYPCLDCSRAWGLIKQCQLAKAATRAFDCDYLPFHSNLWSHDDIELPILDNVKITRVLVTLLDQQCALGDGLLPHHVDESI